MSQTNWPSYFLFSIRGIVVLQLPLLSLLVRVALLHDRLVLGLIDGQTLFRGSVSQLLRLRVVRPVLVAFGAVAREQHHIAARIVQARLVPPNLTLPAQHPELQRQEQMGRPHDRHARTIRDN